MQYDKNNVVILIPCLNPDKRFIRLIDDLVAHGFLDIVVVNDGSNKKCVHYFEEAANKILLLTHAENLGKGRALKTGFNEYLNRYNDKIGIITVDADGQHQVDDIIKVALAMEENSQGLVLGSRDFTKNNIPTRSRWGNVITSKVFKFFTGLKISDTQTGLRGIPNDFIRYLLNVSGERYDFEMNMLVVCKQQDIKIVEIPIETIYLDNNKSSHFNPLSDSLKVYVVFIKYALSSMASITIDWILFYIFANYIFQNLANSNITIFASAILARIVSASVNYQINRHRVFQKNSKHGIVKFFILAALILSASAGLTSLLYNLTGWNMTILKMFVDFLLFFVNFRMQREWVFKNN